MKDCEIQAGLDIIEKKAENAFPAVIWVVSR